MAGKNASDTTSTSLLVNPRPNQMMNRGASAILGAAWKKTM